MGPLVGLVGILDRLAAQFAVGTARESEMTVVTFVLRNNLPFNHSE